MKWILHLGFALVGIILFNTKVANCITCLNCKNIADLSTCEDATVCKVNETCYIEKVLSTINYEPVYNTGCRDMDFCKLELCNKKAYGDGNSRKRENNNDLTLCSQCCFEDSCNAEGCGYKPTQKNITKCFTCPEVYEGGPQCTDTVDCDLRLYACSVTKHQYSHHPNAYELGCNYRRLQCAKFVNLTNEQKDANVKCCDTTLCNVSPYNRKINKTEIAHDFKCPEGIIRTTTTTALPSSSTAETTTTTMATTTERPTTKPPLPPKTTQNLKPTKPSTNNTTTEKITVPPPTKPSTTVSTVSPTFDSHTPPTIRTKTSTVTPAITTTKPTITSTVPSTKTSTSTTTTSTVPSTKNSTSQITTSTVPTTKTTTSQTTTSTVPTTKTTTEATTTSTIPTTQSTTSSTTIKTTPLPTTESTTTKATTVAPTTAVARKTLPPVTTICAVCAGPLFLCEQLYAPTPCAPPNNYCINSIANHLDGTKTVERSCGNIDTCYTDWFEGSSDDDKCRNFDENDQQYLDFQCTFCCTTDNCNTPLHPSKDSLYKPV